MNRIPSEVEPQVEGLLVGVGEPKLPLLTVQPVAGVIAQLLLLSKLHCKFDPTSIPLIDVFVNVATVLVQIMVSGAIVKLACGLVDVVIGSTVDSEKPHGFSARTRMKNELGLLAPDAPHDVVVNVCV